jgi:O-antigen ligase
MPEQEPQKSWIATRRANFLDRERWRRLADALALALVVSLPWSTSLTGIFAALWLVALVPTLNVAGLKRVVATPAGGLPVLFWLLAAVGTLWAFDVPMAERWNGLRSLHKLLVIPLLIFHFQRSDWAPRILTGFLVSCSALLVCSWILVLVPAISTPWARGGGFGIPVKDYIAQGAEFAVCIFVLFGLALNALQTDRRRLAIARLLWAFVFLANMFFTATSRTAVVVIPVLLLLFGLKYGNRRGMPQLALCVVALGIAFWTFAPNVRSSMTGLLREVQVFHPQGDRTRAGERLEFWRRSIDFIADAPLLGHGTGSIRNQFGRAAAGETGMAALVSSNPHNQTFAVAIQWGLVGTAVLFAMWLAHALMFWREGLTAWIGLVVVAQNWVGSLFNSHLFDFTHGWGYVIGVGVAAGAILKDNSLRT